MTAPPDIPDHELLRLIGRGAYGEVWLARNVMGIMRAVKVVRRSSFENERPFAREFAAVKRYEPVSRAAAGLVNVLHAGRAADDALFYYIMELADSAVPGVAAADEPEKFVPCTLRTQIGRMGRMPVAECLEVAVSLANGIADLHRMGLVHRDVKPSNIIFVNGRAKLADIGLLGDITESRSYVGTEGYVPPEGPGQPNADIFALGRVLYEMATGYEATRFPALPPEWAQQGQAAAFEFYEIVLKCCEPDAARRYHTADDLLADLALLQSGQSVRQVRQMRGRLAVLRRVAAAAAVVGLLATAGFFVAQRQAAQEKSLRERAEHAERAAVDARWEALCAHTRAARRDITAGAVTAALKAAREAGALRTSAELRSDAAFLLGRPDLTPRVAPELADRIGKQFISLDLERRRWLHLPYGMNTPPEQRRGTASWRALDSAAATPWPDSFTAAHSWNFITSSDYQWLVDVSAAKGVWNVTTFAPPAVLPPVVVQGWPQPTTRGVIIRARPPGDLVWFEAASGAEQRHVSVPDWNAQEISASPDGASIVLYEKERGLACVDGTSGSVRWRIVMPRAAWPPVWSPDGARLFIMEGSAARVLDAATGVRRSVPDGLWEVGGAEFCFAASRHLLVSTSWGNVTWLHDITRGVPLLRVPDGGRAPVFSSSQKLLGLHHWSFFGARLYDWRGSMRGSMPMISRISRQDLTLGSPPPLAQVWHHCH